MIHNAMQMYFQVQYFSSLKHASTYVIAVTDDHLTYFMCIFNKTTLHPKMPYLSVIMKQSAMTVAL